MPSHRRLQRPGHSSWERDYESSSPSLTAQIDNSDFIVLNDGSFTRIPDRSDQRPSAIDLTLLTPDTASSAEWEVGADSLLSDHLPITVSFVFSAEKETPATTEFLATCTTTSDPS